MSTYKIEYYKNGNIKSVEMHKFGMSVSGNITYINNNDNMSKNKIENKHIIG